MDLIERTCLDALADQLLPIVSKVAVLEMHVAKVQGSLDGKTQQERYRNFAERLSQSEAALAMLLEYPVMARQLVERVEQWVEVILEFLDRLSSDWDSIREALGPLDNEPGTIIHLRTDASDRHRGGRCVLIATFNSGFTLVYKPKSMAVDAHFQQLLKWINARGSHPPLRTLKILDCGCYGWSEFIAPEPCRSLTEIQTFYKRQGAYLALLYVLEATDFHSENVIAAGEHPVPVDLEAIFHPRLKQFERSEEPDSAALSHSVLRVGLLPGQSHVDEEAIVDLSGLSGGALGQYTPNKVPYWEGVGTDEMQLSSADGCLPRKSTQSPWA